LTIVVEILDPVTGIKSGISNDNAVKIYPNPAHNIITINSLGDSGSIDFRNGAISNMYGQTLLTFGFTTSTQDNILDISELSAGTYYLKLVSNKGISINKFVKLK
jgi:hypothetical protein